MFRFNSLVTSLDKVYSHIRHSAMAMLGNATESFENPVLVILGATGAGKSKLALELGQVLNGEIISADSMQVYKGLDIITNKVSEEEQKLCKHHLIGFVAPLEEYTVVDFQKHARHLELERMDSTELYELLEKMDPERSLRLHPKDRRKVIRSIEIFRQTGVKHSDLLQTQAEDRRYGGPLLYRNICFIWVQCQEEVLKERVEKRIEKMLDAGLLTELDDFHKEYNESRLNKDKPPEYEHGIFQSIGFKEFHKYLTVEQSEEGKAKCLRDSIDRMKLSTWQYAKYQTKWLKKRLVNREDSANVYAVDSTFPACWKDSVYYPSLKILQSAIEWGKFVDGIDVESPVFDMTEVRTAKQLEPIPKTPQNFDDTPRIKRCCSLCGGKIFLSDSEWEVHVNSRRHRKSTAAQKRRLNITVDILTQYEDRLKHKVTQYSAEDRTHD